MACEMPVTGQGVRQVMPGDGTDSKECDQAEGEANASKGKGGQAIEEGKGWDRGHIIIDIENTVIMIADAIPKDQAVQNGNLL